MSKINIAPLIRLLERTPGAMRDGAVQALQDELDDWQREARDEAPYESGELRRKIKKRIDKSALSGELSNNVYNDGFNYAYWQHNISEAETSGYLERTRNAEERIKRIEQAIIEELKGKGW